LRGTGGEFASKFAPLVERHEKNMQKWLSLLPIGAVILGMAKFRPESVLTVGIE